MQNKFKNIIIFHKNRKSIAIKASEEHNIHIKNDLCARLYCKCTLYSVEIRHHLKHMILFLLYWKLVELSRHSKLIYNTFAFSSIIFYYQNIVSFHWNFDWKILKILSHKRRFLWIIQSEVKQNFIAIRIAYITKIC